MSHKANVREDLGNVSVIVAMPTRDGNPDHDCFWAALGAANVEKAANAEVKVYPNKYSVTENRNVIVEDFLDSKHTHLMMIDDDVLVQDDAITLLLELDADVATGCYPFAVGSAGGIRTQIAVDFDAEGWALKWPTETRECYACGAGCLLIARRVLEALDKPVFRWPLFPMQSKFNTDKRGEDCRFCCDAIAKGFKIMCHAGVRCGHMGHIDLANLIDSNWCGPRNTRLQKHPPPWGSHLPALSSVARSFPIKTVVEFGCGEFSTKAFLNREMFPDVEVVYSFEHDQDWIDNIGYQCRDDDRLTLSYCHIESMPDAAAMAPDGDLVFIDSGRPSKGGCDYNIRGKLLTHYEGCSGIVVMHDTETSPLNAYAKGSNFQYKQCYIPPLGPSTGIFSNHKDLSQLSIQTPTLQVANAE